MIGHRLWHQGDVSAEPYVQAVSGETKEAREAASPLASRRVWPWQLPASLLAVVGALAYRQAPSSGLGASFIVAAGVPLIASTLGLPSLWLRGVRLVAGGTAAVSGAVLSLQLGYMVTVGDGEDPTGLSVALTFALVFASVAAWLADLRLAARDAEEQRSRDAAAALRHAELLARHGPRRAQRRAVRLRDLVLLGITLRVLRR